MTDLRIQNLARILVRYSIEARKGQTVGVRSSTAGEPLVTAVAEELLRAGAFPALRMAPDGYEELLFRRGKPVHFDTIPPFDKAYARTVDSTIVIRAETNTRALSSVSPKRQMQLGRTMKPVWDTLRSKPWVITVFPTAAYAQDAEMSLTEYEHFVFGATFADADRPVGAWRRLHRRQQRLIDKLQGADRIRIVSDDTDLTLSVKGRTFINSDGHRNMPSGEIFTSPVETSADGYIRYNFPVCRSGREITGIRLVFRKGVVVEATAEKNQAFLRAALDTDKGARRLGELGIGANTGIQRFTRHILFDEKIGGSVHLAVGQSFTEAGGRNRSALHWDMIKDLRQGGAIYVDGKLFQKDGRFR